MKPRRTGMALAIILFSLMVSCSDSSYKEKVPKLLGKHLKDPYTAVYKYDYLLSSKGDFAVLVCGTVNAKGGFGGYVGQRPFVILYDPNPMTSNTEDIGSIIGEKARCETGKAIIRAYDELADRLSEAKSRPEKESIAKEQMEKIFNLRDILVNGLYLPR